MIKTKNMDDWLRHRFGEKLLDKSWPRYETKALELNEKFDEKKNFGNKDIYGYIGFIDLIGFSESVKGKTPLEVANFILPFLNEVCAAITSYNGLIDKTIGDEIMFIFPEMSGERGVPAILSINSIIEKVKDLKEKYSFRFGLSYGKMHLGRIKSEGFKEWSVFGESVNLAKRLVEDKESNSNIGTFAVLMNDPINIENYELLSNYLFDCHKIQVKTIEKPKELKGISEYKSFTF